MIAGVEETRAGVAILRTIHLVEGVPSCAVPGSEAGLTWPGGLEIAAGKRRLRGKWVQTGDDLWLWLDRERHLALRCRPGGQTSGWCEAGETLRVIWTSEAIVIWPAGINEEVQREETRLADREAAGRTAWRAWRVVQAMPVACHHPPRCPAKGSRSMNCV